MALGVEVAVLAGVVWSEAASTSARSAENVPCGVTASPWGVTVLVSEVGTDVWVTIDSVGVPVAVGGAEVAVEGTGVWIVGVDVGDGGSGSSGESVGSGVLEAG